MSIERPKKLIITNLPADYFDAQTDNVTEKLNLNVLPQAFKTSDIPGK